MKPYPLIFSLFILSFFGCSSYTFVKTGPSYPALADTAEVQVYVGEKRPAGYTEIGSVRLTGNENPNFMQAVFRSYDRYARAVELAKHVARENGGDCVILINRSTRVDVETNSATGNLESQNEDYFDFIVGKLSR